eukprot:2597292-Rhodomonas_salina.1
MQVLPPLCLAALACARVHIMGRLRRVSGWLCVCVSLWHGIAHEPHDASNGHEAPLDIPLLKARAAPPPMMMSAMPPPPEEAASSEAPADAPNPFGEPVP